MPLFNFRRGAGDAAPTAQPESVETLRRRARHRLIGAVVLVAAGVVGFPMLFDTQPRPVAVDLDIEIPDKASAKPMAPLTPPVRSAASAATRPAAPAPTAALPAASATKPVTTPATTPTSRVAAAASLDAKEEVISSTSEPKRPAAQVNTAQAAIKTEAASKPEPKPEPKPERKPEPKPEPTTARTDDGAKARALLEGRSPEAPPATSAATTVAAAGERFIVQVGAFADPDKARETRLKVEKAGLKTYTHVAETKDGPRTRVRVGPFASRAEADKAADRIKALDLPANILSL